MDELELPSFIADGMILQQNVSALIWGKSCPGAAVGIQFRSKTYRGAADESGAWRIRLEPQDAGGPWLMEISAGGSKKIIKDIYIGEVWLCSGQSNMELPMSRLKDNYPEAWTAPNPLIRQFTVPLSWDFSGPRDTLAGGTWLAASAETLGSFSGTAWFFANYLYAKYKQPVGVIVAACGGTPIEAWMSRDALSAFPEKIAQGDRFADTAYYEKICAESAGAVSAWERNLLAQDVSSPFWASPEFDDASWGELVLPGDFTGPGLENLCGVLWLRRKFTAPGFAGAEAKVWLGTIVDSDTVYLNGVKIGSTGYRYPPRKYTVPQGLLHEGENHIAIRVVCNNGAGGITRGKDFRVFCGAGAVELSGGWKYQVSARTVPRPRELFVQYQPFGCFNAMLNPALPYEARGILWYQGESNESNAGEYAALFTSLIKDWRKKKGREDIPFLFVQLPLFGEPAENNETSSWAQLREAQRLALELPATGMAAALDLGEWNDLHPLNKKDVGYRLFLAAESLLHHARNDVPGPLLRRIERRRNTLVLFFDNCGDGLRSRGVPSVTVLSGGAGRRLPAHIKGKDRLQVDISRMGEPPETVMYAWADNPADRQLCNSSGLPAIPFRAAVNRL